MAFPVSLSDFKVEVDLDGDWFVPTDISAYVYTRDGVDITRGKSAEGSTVDPSAMTLTLKNTDGRFSVRNPTGPYYGRLGRNTGIRASVLAGDRRAVAVVPASSWFQSVDSAALSITGDIDIRVDLSLPAWRRGAAVILASKWTESAANQRSWQFDLLADGTFKFFWSTTGADILGAVSTVPVPYPVGGRRAVRVTFDVNNGASGNTATFYTAPTMAGPWTVLGDPVVAAGATSIFDSTAPLLVNLGHGGDVYEARVYSGLTGTTLKAGPIFTSQAEGATSFSDAQANPWTASSSNAVVTARRMRFYGEVASWPQQWDPSGNDVWTSISAAGVLRRLGAAGAGFRSTLYRGVTLDAAGLVAYWPMEDAEGSSSLASAAPGGRAAKFAGPIELASFSDFKSSAPLPVLKSSSVSALVLPYADTGAFQARFLMAVPSTAEVDGTAIARIFAAGTAQRWDLSYATTSGGSLQLKAFDRDGSTLLTSSVVTFGVNGKRVQVSVELDQNGTGIDWHLFVLNDDGSSPGGITGTLASQTLGRATQVVLNPNLGLQGTALGHLYVQSQVTPLSDISSQVAAWVGEGAGARIARLCAEEGVAVALIGDGDDSEPMGPQSTAATLVELLSEAAETDQGLLFEPRNQLGLGYRTRVSLHNQASGLDLDYAAAELTGLEPVDDDQELHNDVTISRLGGSSYRATQTEGPLSTEPAPVGVGRYELAVQANPETDPQLKHEAGWRLHLGTADEARYPSIVVNLAHPLFTGDSTLTSDALDLDVGDRVDATNLPAWLPPDDLSQLVRGTRDRIGAYAHAVEFVGTAERPWRVGLYDDPAGSSRYHSDGSTLVSGVTSSATSLSVATADGPLWTTDAAQMPLDIEVSGERMTVTSISGTSSPQTFTVTRSVNGVVKAQAANATVDLADPTYYSI